MPSSNRTPDRLPAGTHAPGGSRRTGRTGRTGRANRRRARRAGAGTDLLALLTGLRRHLLLILGTGLLVGAAAAVWTLRATPEYRATAVIRLTDGRRAMAGTLDDGATDKILGRNTDPVLSQMRLLKSRSVAAEVVDREGLRLRVPASVPGLVARADPSLPPERDTRLEVDFGEAAYRLRSDHAALTARYGEPLELEGIEVTAAAPPPGVETATVSLLSREVAIDSLLANVSARREALTDVVEIRYGSSDSAAAPRVVNALARAFQAASIESAREASRGRREFLEQQIVEIDSLLEERQVALSSFRARERVFSSQDKIAAQQADLTALELRRNELVTDRQMYAALLAALQGSRPGETSERLGALVAAPGISSNSAIAQLFGQLASYESELAGMTTGPWSRAPGSPDVQRLQALIESTRQKLVVAAQGFIAAQDARIAATGTLLASRSSAIAQLPAAEAEEVRLVQQFETVRLAASQVRSEYQKARIAESVAAGQVEIVDYAASSRRARQLGAFKIAFGLLTGLLLGSGAGLLREFTNGSIRDREELDELLELPSLGIIPRVAPAPRALPAGKRPAGGKAVAALRQARAPATEAYRMLRSTLAFSHGPELPRTLIVTSARAGEGKSTTASNLARTFAEAGMRVLLIDADLRKPQLHDIFGIPRAPGLSQVLSGSMPASLAIHASGQENLFLLSAGAPHADPAQAFLGGAFAALLEHLVPAFELIVVDTPPVLAVSETTTLAALADAVIFVVQAGQTPRAAASEALHQLDAVGARTVGGILNDPNGEVRGYYGYYSYAESA